MNRVSGILLAMVVLLVGHAGLVRAQDANDDAVLKPAEPDFTLVSLPTSLRLPKFKGAFRVTHRFLRPVNCDTCPNSFAGDGFGSDGGSTIGIEYRFGIVPNGEIGVARTNDKTVALVGQYGLLRQGTSSPVEASVIAGVDVSNVGQQHVASDYSPSLGVIVARLVTDRAAVYAEPIWVHHSNLFEETTVTADNTLMVGLGSRVRVWSTLYVVGEVSPRVAGYHPGVAQGSLAVEKRLGGHMFQLNFSNALGTTLGQIARGGRKELTATGSKQDWYMGFNISRKFF